MPLVAPFRTSFGTETTRDILLVRVAASGPAGAAGGYAEAEGWGECVSMSDPLYSAEYVEMTADVLRRFMIPRLAMVAGLTGPAVAAALEPFKGHWMAKAALEMAVLDAELRL